MSIKLGNTDINKIYLGPTEIKKAYLGSTLIYDKTATANGLLNNLVSYYEFENNVVDSHGTNNGTNFGTSDVAGKIGRGRSFDGVNDYVDVPLIDITGYSEISINIWVKYNSVSSIGKRVISINHSGTSDDISFYFDTNGDAYFKMDDGVNTQIKIGTSLNSGTWYMFSGTYDGTIMKGFLNGVEIGSTAKSFNFSTAGGGLNFGRASGGATGTYYDGDIDENGIWDKSLTQSDFTSLYNSGAGLAYSNFTT